ncbi:MAG: hypothetical protein QOI44_2371 [Actinomycetota bacterium]|nr:hypothetical protein [Actinomycetota bacterium]
MPPPTWPGDAGVGEAFSHGEEPVALPTITCNAPDRIAVSGVVVAVDVEVVAAGFVAFVLELEHPAVKMARTANVATRFLSLTRPPSYELKAYDFRARSGYQRRTHPVIRSRGSCNRVPTSMNTNGARSPS